MEYVKGGYRVATSKTAQRTVLQTFFLGCGSFVLFGLSTIAYILFYHNYLPDQITTIPLHLQYGRSQHPYAIALLHDRNIKELQDYDITVSVSLPRSPKNLERGNFMLSLYLSDGVSPGGPPTTRDPKLVTDPSRVIYSESRPALIPYADPAVSLASRVIFLAWHILFPVASAREDLVVPMAERLSFRRRGRVPTALLVEIATLGEEPALRTYSAAVTFTAQLRGLSWLMYRWRVTSFVLFTTAFWICSTLSMLVGWLLVSLCLGSGRPPKSEDVVVKEEFHDGHYQVSGLPIREDSDEDKLPTTPRMLASTSRGPPPSYSSGGSKRANMGLTMRPVIGSRASSTGDLRDSPSSATAATDYDWNDGGGGDNERWSEQEGPKPRDFGVGTSAPSTGHDDGGGSGGGGHEGGSLRRRSSQRSIASQ